MDALNARFADWSRSQAAPVFRSTVDTHQDEDYFSLVHDDQPDEDLLHSRQGSGHLRAAGGSDTSDEARTPRATSPRPLSKAALHSHHELMHQETQDSSAADNRWSGNFDFIHPDHLV